MALPRVRLGIAGAGMVSRTHAHAFRALTRFDAPVQVELAAIADPVTLLAEALAAEAVIVALPNFQHRAVVEGLLTAGKHVLSEKPLANTAHDSFAMLRAARRS